MTTYNPNISGHFPIHASKMSGFFFRKRVERIDWKRLASVDVRKVASQVDIDVLQENLFSVAFCDIDSEIDTRYVDTNLVKLFQLAQLLIEYLLYSQDYLTGTVDSLRRENEKIKKETDLLRKRLDEQAQRLTTTRKECHRRRLLLLAQQRLMNNGPQSYFHCPHCPKAFINASFLNAHLFRRHTEVVTALQNVDLNTSGLLHQSFECEVSQIKKKAPVEQHQATLSTNLEQQIKEVLDHVQKQILPPSQLPPPPPVSSAFVQTSAHSPDSIWKNRAAELERLLKEEREQLILLEERNRTWQEAITTQHKVDVERVREMFEIELRNLREENLEKQKELLQLRIKGAIPLSYGDLEDDVPRQLERQVKSLEKDISVCQDSATIISTPQSMLQTESENSEAPSFTETYTLPSFKMVNNANKAGIEDSLTTLEMFKMFNEPSLCNEAFTLCSEASESSKNQPQTQQISRRDIRGRCKGVCTPVIQTESTPSKVKFDRENQVASPLVSLKSGAKNQKLKTEDKESEQTAESIHLIPFVIPASNNKTQTSVEASPKRGRYQPRAENRIVQIVDDDDYTIKHAKERLRQSSSAEKAVNVESEKAEKSLQASEPQMRANALEGVPHYKVQLKEFRANPSVMRRFRDEAESLFEEQLMDHNIEPSAKGLSRNKSNELTDILGQERLHLARKFPNFWEIRASLSRKVDRLAFQALHSKREYTSSSPNRDERGSFKRARSSRASERGRPPSGRPSSLTSLGTTLSPIAEHHHGATAPPTLLRRPAGATQAQSKQSLFENSGNEDDDVVEVSRNKKAEMEIKGGRRERTTKKSSQPLDGFEDSDDDLEEGEEIVHDKSTPPSSSVKFYGKNRHNMAENEDLDYRFVRREVGDDDDDDYLEIDK